MKFISRSVWHFPHSRCIGFALFTAVLAAVAQPHPTSTWTGAVDNRWDTAGNWDPSGVPPTNAIAVINSGTPDATLAGLIRVYEVDLNGGTFTLNGLLMLDGTSFVMQGGTLATGAGGGTIGTTNEAFFDWHSGSLDGVLSLATGAQARLSSAGGKYLDDGAELHNYGTVTWTDGPIIAWTYNGLATIRNHAGSSFIASGGTGLDLYYGYQTALFVVDTGAQFTKTDVLDVTENWVLQNDGRLAVNNGATRWNRGGASSGLFTNQPGGLFAFSGGTHTLAEGTLLAGDGSFRVEGGIVSANGVVTHGQPGSPGVLELAAGEITGSNFVAAGSFVWSGGSIGGLFTVLPGAVANLDGAGGKYLDDFALFENRGTVTWTDGPIIAWTYNGTATIHNHAGSSFLASGGTGLSLYYGNQFASFIVDADAQFTKTDALDVTENWVLQNDGRLAVNNGAARWNRGGASSGLFTNQPEGLFAFSGGTHTLADGTRLAGDGNFRVEGGVVAANGVVTHGQPGSPGVLELTAGEITGSNFVAAGSFVWSGGSMGGLFTVLPGAVANLNGPGGRYLDDFALFENRGTVTWTDGPIIAWTYNGPATILNSSNALFNLAANATPFSRYYGNQEFRFTNSPGAVLRQSVAATVPAGSIWLAQQGEVRVDTGVLQFNSPVTLADGGRFTGAGLVQQTGDNIYLSGRLTLDGTSFEQQNGNFVMGAGGGTIATTNSAFFGWKSGWLIGRLTTTNGTQTLVSGTDGKYLGDAAEWHNYGTVTWTDGPIVAWTYNGTATLFNHATGRCIASSSMLGLSRYYGYQDAFFINDGTLALGTPGGQTTVSGWRFTQNASGLLELALAGTNAVADFGVWTFDSSAALAGSVHVVLANGFTPAAGQVFTFLQAAPCSGGFSGVQLPTLPAGLTMSVDTDSSSASLRVDAMGPCAPPPAGLIAWFPADDSAADVVGLRQAQLQDPTGYTSGKVGRAFRFNGSSDQVLLGSWFNLQEFSVSMWVKAGLSQAAYADIIDNNHTGSRSWVVEYANSGDAAHSDFGWGLANIGYIPFSLTKGVWQHLALTIDTNHIANLYLDGALVGTAAGAGPIAYDGSQFLRLGAWGGGGRNLNGAIDDLIIFNRALAQGEIAAITAASITGICRTNASCVAPPPGLLGWWPGDGNTTNLVAGGDPAVLLSGTTTAPGLVGGAFSLDGTGLVSIGDLAGLQSATQITVMAWVQKTPGPDNIGGIIGKWDTGPNPAANSFLLFNGETEPGNEFINRGALALQFTNDSIGLVQGSSLLPGSDWASNHWTHVAATWNSADGLMKLYKNGALDGLATNGLGQTLRHHTQFTAKVGEWGPNTRPNSRWIGLIDEPMVFNRALASNEIAAIVAAGTTGLCRPDSGTTNQPPSTNTLPDLAVSAVITPATALIGQSVPVVFTLTNLGQTSAFGPWVNQFLSATNAAGLGTQSLSTTSFVSEIAPAGSVTLTQTVALPVSLSGGIYLGVRADSAGNVVEANESNNLAFAASSIWISAPDLLITQILPPAGGVMGQPAPIIFTITNAGDAVATGPWLQQILLAADTNGSGALSLGSFNFTNSLPPGGSVTVTQAVTLAIGAFGTRFLGVAADSANNVLESNEANNTSYATTATIISAPDLLVARITAPASGIMGQTAQIIFTLTNGGNSTALAPWSNQLLLASDTNGSGAQSLGSFSVTNSIPPGGSVTITQIVTLPLAAFGAQFLGVLTDSANDVPESNENNNIACAAGATMITVPDLAVTQIIAPAGGIMGRPAQIVFTLTNGGSSPALAPWANQILLATDANGAGAQVISTFSLTNDLAPGASVTITQAATLPAGAMGERFLGVLTDSANNVPESNDYNNAAYAALGTTITAPDLAVLQITAPATALMGQAVPLVFTLTNGGNATAFAPWLNQVFLATNTNGTGAQILGAADFTNDLAAGASVTVTQNVILPTGVFGVRYVGVVVDSANDVAESDENNNTLVASSGLLISGPDLAVTQLSAPTSARFGQSFAVLFAVTNVGTSPAGAAWQDQLFLSTVSNSVAGAISLGTLPGSSPLAPGEGYSRTQMVTLPLTVSSAAGNYFIVAATDASDAQAESSEANNLASVPIPLALPPLPDLAVPQVTAPATALPDRNVTVSWSLTNNGTASATGPWSETVAVSNAAYGLVVLAEFRFTNVLDAGQLLTRTQDVAVPNTLPAGDWNVLVLADARSEIVEGCEANNTGVATNLATVPALLTLQVGVSQIQEGAPPFFATVTRNGDRTTPLVVVITNSDPARLAITNTVTIPAGANSATFSVQAIHDNLVLGNEFVVFNVTNDSYQGDSWGLNVLEIDVPQLTLAFGAPSVTEGLTVPCTVSRDYETGSELVVVLNAADPTQLLPPASVTIPSNQLSYTFAVLAVDNNVPEPTRTSYLIASAAGFQTTNASVAILDNDTPTVTLTLAAHSVSEGAGPQATIATVTRSLITPRWLTLLLQNSDPGSVQIPSTVTIPANAPSVSFPVAALDNNVVDGTRTVTLRVFLLDPSSQVYAEGTGDTLQVLDDDGPTLKLSIDRDAVPEAQSPAATATITRNTSTAAPLTVSLASSALNKITLPASVDIPAGASSVTVPLTSVNDGIPSGNQSVTVTASAAGFTPGVGVIVVTDINLPDLVVRNVTAPTNGITDTSFSVTYRIENRGLAACTSNFVTRIFLSTDAVLSSDDQLLGKFPSSGTLPVGQFIEQTAQFQLPSKSGQYWVIIITDAANQVPEVLEDNNTFVVPLPITVGPAYTARVHTTLTTALAGTPVPMTGSALRADGSAAANVPVNIHLFVRGTHRVFVTQTDASGNFALTWGPLPTEAGNYQIGAAHPGEDSAPVQGSFTFIGVKLTPAIEELTVIEHQSLTSHVAVLNLGENSLNSLAASVVSAPANLSVTATLSTNSLAGDDTCDLAVVLTANNATVLFGEVHVRVTASGGISQELVIGAHVAPLHPHLAALPDSLYSTMLPGKQTSVQFEVINDGGAATGPLTISIPSAPWLAVSSTNPMPPMPPGTTNHVTLLLTPSFDLPLGPYRNNLVVGDGVALGVSVPFEFLCVSEGKGSLRITAVDEYTFYATGAPNLTNAAVIVRDPITQLIVTNGITDAQGQVLFPGLLEAYYNVEVSADQHSSFAGMTLLRGGRTNDFEAFLSRQTVQYHWSVVPATIEDQTHITLTTEFETFVPVPVVTIDPPLIDLKDFSGAVTQINLVISNHGLIAAQDFAFDLPTHETYEFISLVNELGPIPAMSSMTVPLTIQRIGATPSIRSVRVARPRAASGGGACSVSLSGCFNVPCGGRKNKHCTPVAVMNVGNCTPPSLPSGSVPGNGGTPNPFFWTPPPNGGGGGGYYLVDSPGPFAPTPPFSFTPPKICDCDPSDFDELCLQVPLSSTLLNAALEALSSTVSKLKFVSDVSAKSEGKAELCICCAKPEGLGLKLSGGGSVTFKGKATFPMGGYKLSKTISSGGYDFTISGSLGCTYEQDFEVTGSVNGKTDCLLKNPQIDGSLSVDLPASFSCAAQVHVIAKQGGRLVGEVDIGPEAQVDYGLSGSVKYHADEKSSSLTGEICGKGLKVHASLPVKIPNILDVSVTYDDTLVEEACITFGTPAAAAVTASILAAADQKYQDGINSMQRLAAAKTGTPTATAAAVAYGGNSAKPRAASTEDGVCAKVKLQIDQDVIMARSAFNATLELGNTSTTSGLSNISVTLVIQDEFGNSVNEVFGIRPPVLAGLTGVDGTGTVAANATGSASWILVPTSDAAPFGPTRYGVGGLLTYYQDGNSVTIPLFSAPITVYPDPRLSVKYFLQRDVYADDPFTHDVIEPSVPFSLAVMVDNHGVGTARDMKIVSSQPKIIENEKGLLINFEIIASQVENQPQDPSLTVTLGEILPGTNKIARWLLTSTLQGLFTDYQATFQHLDSLGKTNLSLIDDVSIHQMIHLVQAPGAFEDGRPDFLVNDIPDPDSLPDTLYLSSGATSRVEVVRQATDDGPPTADNLIVHLTAPMPPGWTYLRVHEPSDGQFILQRVVRSDGVEIYFGTNVWTTDRVFIGQGQRPIYTNQLHLFDYGSTGSYTLYYATPPPVDTTAPASTVAALPAASYSQFSVNWNGDDGPSGSGVRGFDIYVSDNGAPFSPWLQNTPLHSSVYQGQSSHTYAFYSVAVDNQGNRETAPLQAQAQTVITLTNSPPTITVPAIVVIDEGTTLSLDVIASDPDPQQTLTFSLGAGTPPGLSVDSLTGHLTWQTGEADGPGTNHLRIIVTDNGQPPLSATGLVTVVVNEVNTPPTLGSVTNHTINELQKLTIQMVASDSDLPAQTLTFLLDTGAPLGATITADSGIFAWTPTDTQGPSTNQISVIVRDNGTPQLSATQTFIVFVRDTSPDFSLRIGSTNVLAGLSDHVPVEVRSGLDLTNITLFLDLSASALSNLTLTPIAPSVASATLSPAGGNTYQMQLNSAVGDVLNGNGEFARLSFTTTSNLPSAIVYLVPRATTGFRSSGGSLSGGSTPGRVIVINHEPILTIGLGEPRGFTLFAQPGYDYGIEHNPDVNDTNGWRLIGLIPMTNQSRTISVGGSEPLIFYRSYQTNAP